MTDLDTYRNMLTRAEIVFQEFTKEGVIHIDVFADGGQNQDGYCNFACSHQFKEGVLVRVEIWE